jgi:hypothetical protein
MPHVTLPVTQDGYLVPQQRSVLSESGQDRTQELG